MPRSRLESAKASVPDTTGGLRRARTGLSGLSTSTHDITIPPTPHMRRDLDPMAPGSEAWRKERKETAAFHGVATIALSGMLVVWTFSRGAVPALDPRAGLLLLVLQLGACVTGWLALESVRDLQRVTSEDDPALPSWLSLLGVAGVASLLLNTAMAFAALLP